MIIRSFKESDIKALERICQDYQHEFSINEFNDFKFSDLFAVSTDNDSDIISLGGVRTLAEVVIVTDKNVSARSRVEGLNLIQNTASYIARRDGFNSLHAFVQDRVWLEQLMRNGFRQTKGVALVCDVE
jgi:hypothetical protein